MTGRSPHADPTVLCLARHGETDWNVTGVLQGWIDVPLNDSGRQQAREMAVELAMHGFSGIWSSSLRRASETALILAAALELPAPVLSDGLRERHFGIIEGMPKQDIAERAPGLYDCILRRDPSCRFEGGETRDGFADRVIRCMHAIAARHRGERVLVVTHGWVMDVVTRHVRGLPRSQILGMKRKNGETLWLRVTDDAIAQIDPPQPRRSSDALARGVSP